MVGGTPRQTAPLTASCSAEILFQQSDLPAEGGLGDMQPLGRVAQAAKFGDMQEGAKLS